MRISATLIAAMLIILSGAPGDAAAASSGSPFMAKYKTLVEQRRAIVGKLDGLAKEVKTAGELKAQLNLLQLASKGDPGALKALKGSGLEAPKDDKTHPCVLTMHIIQRIDVMTDEAAEVAREAANLLNASSGEPSKANLQATNNAAKAVKRLTSKTDALEQTIKSLQGQMESLQSASRIDMSAVNTWRGRINTYDKATERLQTLANQIEPLLQPFETERGAFDAVLAAARNAAPEDPIPPMYERQVRALSIDSSAIAEARKLTWTADADIRAYHAALEKVSSARTQAAGQEADICDQYGKAADRKAIVDRAGTKLAALRDAFGTLLVALIERMTQLEDFQRRNDDLKTKAAAKMDAATKAGDPVAKAKIAEIQKRAQERGQQAAEQNKALSSARTDAGKGQSSIEGGINLFNITSGK